MINSGWSTKIQLNPNNLSFANDPDAIADQKGNTSFQFDYEQANNNQQLHSMGFSWNKSPQNNNINNSNNTCNSIFGSFNSFNFVEPSFLNSNNQEGTSKMNYSTRSDNNNYYNNNYNNNNNNNFFNVNNNSNNGTNNGNVEGLQKKTFNNLSKSSDFYPSLNIPNYGSGFDYPAKIDPWKQQGFLPEPIEEKENDGLIIY